MTTIGPKNIPELPELPEGQQPLKKTINKEVLSVIGVHRGKETKVEIPKNHIPAPTDQELHQAEPLKVRKESLLDKGKKYITGLREILGGQAKKAVSAVQFHPAAQVTHSDADRYNAMTKLITYLNSKGNETEGLLRISGSAPEIHKLEKNIYNANETIPNNESVDVATGVLKNIWREASFNKLTEEQTAKGQMPVGQILKEVNSSGEPDLKQLKERIKDEKVLTKEQRQILDAMLGYAVNVAKNSDQNKMPASNIATILAPALAPPPSPGSFPEFSDITSVLTAIIEHNSNPANTPFKFSG